MVSNTTSNPNELPIIALGAAAVGIALFALAIAVERRRKSEPNTAETTTEVSTTVAGAATVPGVAVAPTTRPPAGVDRCAGFRQQYDEAKNATAAAQARVADDPSEPNRDAYARAVAASNAARRVLEACETSSAAPVVAGAPPEGPCDRWRRMTAAVEATRAEWRQKLAAAEATAEEVASAEGGPDLTELRALHNTMNIAKAELAADVSAYEIVSKGLRDCEERQAKPPG